MGARVARFCTAAAFLALATAFSARADASVDVEAVAERNGPAVVTIYGERGSDGQAVQGSGCCIRADGLILTVAHAVQGVDRLRVRFSDGRELEATLLEADPARDVALLRAGAPAIAAALGDASSLKAGAPLVAISAPKGLHASVSTGIVSSTERSYDGRPVLQSDLDLNEGSSGGPVFDRAGRLIGLVRARLDAVDEATLVLPVNEAYGLLRRQGMGVPGPGQGAAPYAAVSPGPRATDAEREAIETYNRAVAATAPAEKIESYGRATALAPEFFEAWFNLGVAYAADGRDEDAVAAYRHAQALRPDSPEVLRNLGRVLLRLDRLGEVEQCFKKAVEVAPEDPGVHNDLGEAYRRQGRLDDARKCFLHALRLRPDYAAARYNLGLTFAAMERWPEALASFRSYLRLAPDAPDADEVRAWIADLEKKKG